MSILFIKEKLSKHLIVWAVCILFTSTFTAFTFWMNAMIPSPIPFLVKNITMVVFLPFFLWFSFVFINRRIMPLINQSNTKINRLISALLILLIAIMLITAGELPRNTTRPLNVLGLRILISIVTTIVCYIFSAIITEQTEIQKMMEENQQKEKMLDVSTEQFIALSDKIEETRRARHDLKFHLSAIKAFVNEQDYINLSAYLENDTLLPDSTVLRFCNHPTLNILLSYYRDISKGHQIHLDVTANVASDIFLSDNELWVLLGNLLENAIEGTKELNESKRHIQVKMQANATSLVLTVDNPYEERNLKREGEEFVSTKDTDGVGLRGVGLKSVAFLAEKYNGLATFETKNDWFLSSVTMYHVG